MEMDIGIGERERERTADGLAHLLADTYSLYLRTHAFHWNVTGPLFETLHLMFERQYKEIRKAVDEIAERIRALGYPAPGTYRQLMALNSLPPEEEEVPEATAMLRILVRCHEACARTAREVFHTAEDADDQATCDLLTERMRAHEKTAWMLRSMIERERGSALRLAEMPRAVATRPRAGRRPRAAR